MSPATIIRAPPPPPHIPGGGDAALPREGDLVAGKYRIENLLGRGATAVVMAARHIELGHRVAIKFLVSAHDCPRPVLEARFLEEARTTVQISSEHVVRITDFGRLEDGNPYQLMELLDGADLAQLLLERKTPFAVEEAVGYVLQACEAIAEAHALGVVHRDLKPANLFLSRRADGSALVKVLDFGISKSRTAAASVGRTALLGTPAYMSPEQVEDPEAVDARTDVWALGATLYELLTGRLVYEGGSLDALLARIASDPPTPASARRPEVPRQLDRVLLRCLEKDPAARMPNVAELARALLPFAPSGSELSVARIANCAVARGTARCSAVVGPMGGASQEASPGGHLGAVATVARRKLLI
jgi:serine/threonine-protein kinase